MAKGKYEYWLTDDGLLLLGGWARDGLTDEQIAYNMHISTTTYYEWKKRYPEIAESIKENKAIVDTKVVNALYENTQNRIIKVQKTFKVKKVLVKDGVRQEIEELQTGEDEVFVRGDTTAQIYWTKNRLPADWRDKKEVELSGSKSEVITEIEDYMSQVRSDYATRAESVSERDTEQSG